MDGKQQKALTMNNNRPWYGLGHLLIQLFSVSKPLSVGGLLDFALISAVALGANQAWASPETSAVCDHAARSAAKATGVPISVLQAITRTETGRTRNGYTQPWPWTVNMEGKGAWFDSEDEARTYVFRHFKRGARSFDVGCFQINYKWHGQAFRSIDEMFDPEKNAHYAAKFLSGLYSELGNWSDAAGAYHSRTPEYANKYKARFDRFRTKLAKADTSPMRIVVPVAEPQRRQRSRVNTFPLLQAGVGNAALGSLVQLNQQSNAAPLFQRSAANGG